MRDFFIRSLETIINVVMVVGGLGVLIATVAVASNPYGGGMLAALAVLVGGTLYLMLVGGIVYLGLGIYHNTRRTAEAIEAMPKR